MDHQAAHELRGNPAHNAHLDAAIARAAAIETISSESSTEIENNVKTDLDRRASMELTPTGRQALERLVRINSRQACAIEKYIGEANVLSGRLHGASWPVYLTIPPVESSTGTTHSIRLEPRWFAVTPGRASC